MSLSFIIGQFGILLEFVGALIIVVAAFRNKMKVAALNSTWEGIGYLDEVREAIQAQAITEFRGFFCWDSASHFSLSEVSEHDA